MIDPTKREKTTVNPDQEFSQFNSDGEGLGLGRCMDVKFQQKKEKQL